MGSFNLADCLTGLSIGHHEPVVAFVVAQAQGGYPKAEDTLARTARGFGDICRLASLPIYGTYDDYGRVEPDNGQLAVKLACGMVGAKDWKEFDKTALDWQTGAAIKRDGPFARMQGETAGPTKVFGMSVMHRASWDHVMAMEAAHADRGQEVHEMGTVIMDAMRRMAARASDDDTGRYHAISVLELGSSSYTYADGRKVRLPELGRALSSGRDVHSHDFKEWLLHNAVGGPKVLDKWPDGPPWLAELLGGLWDTTAFCHGLEWHNRTLLSSAGAGQLRDDDKHFALALLTLETAGSRFVEHAQENGPSPDAEAFKVLLERMDALRIRLQAGMDKALEGEPEGGAYTG
jgi:hypothetical protein